MAWIRYIVYFVGIALVTWGLTQMELASPGSLKLNILVDDYDILGTSEYSPVEIIQAIILGACGVIMAWVAKYCPSQRPIAFLFGGMALIFLVRELDYFFDRFLVDNLWQVLVVIAGALVMAYTLSTTPASQDCIGTHLAVAWPDVPVLRCRDSVRVCAARRSRALVDVDSG